LAEKNVRVWNESFGFFIDNNPYLEEQALTNIDNEFYLVDKVYASDNSFKLPVLPKSGVSAGSGRIYIWDKTMDLVKNRPILGYGLDSLMYNFPHYNIDARAGLKTETSITDKPHNLYVGILYGTGILGFISLIIILFMVGLDTVVNLFKKNRLQYFVLAFASLAYFIQAMFNDSLPGISGVIWILIGVLFSIMFTEKEVEENNQ
jgi:O-Antigen ligase